MNIIISIIKYMACCFESFLYIKEKINNCFNDFDDYLNKILEIKNNKNKEYNLIDFNEINKYQDNIIIEIHKDIPIDKGYNII